MSDSSPQTSDAPAIPDAHHRARIGPWQETGAPDLSDFERDTNFFVRAAAGSGKTTALVGRMVSLVRTGVSADQIAAITFTRKAAGEMSERFYEELQKVHEALPDGSVEKRRVGEALRNAHRTFIGTIHSFCARLLRERPLAAGVPPDFVAGLEDREERELRERAWQRYLRRLHRDEPHRIERITELGLEPGDLEAYFARLCNYPELEAYTRGPEEAPDMTTAVDAVRRHVDEWQRRRPDPLPERRDKAMRALDRAENMLRYRSLEDPVEQAALLDVMTDASDDEKAKVTLKCWGERGSDAYKWAKTLRDELLPGLIREAVQPALRRWQAHVHREVVSFVRPAVQVFQELRREEGKLTFHDLLQCTRDLLRDHPPIREAFQERYGWIMVDEFQDTDPLQAEVLFYLTSRDPAETNWRACNPRPGRLFIVGDDKQSIYRFRRADMDMYNDVGKLLDDQPDGEEVILTTNFRSVSGICEWCNEAFGEIFGEPELRDLQADYQEFDPFRGSGGEAPLRRIDIDKVGWNRGEDIAEKDARRMARFIRAARRGELPDSFYGEEGGNAAVFEEEVGYDDFLILTRTKTRLDVYAETMAEHGIPYTVTGSEDLGDSQELKAIVDLLTCTLRPDDPVACVAYLKGTLVGCSDEELYRYSRAGGRFDQMHEPVRPSVLDGLDERLADKIARAFDRLQRAQELLHEERPGVAVQQAIDEFGLLAGAAHPDQPAEGSLRAGYVLRALTLVQELAARGMGWAAVQEELQRVLDGERDVDGMTLETGEGGAVRIMNVHQAKGLQAPVVFLADPYSSGGNQKITRHISRDTGRLVAPIVQGADYYERITHAPLGWHDESEQAFRALEERHEQAEERRLLYVAATRARNLLVASTYLEKMGDGYWGPLDRFLEGVPELPAPATEVPVEPGQAPAPHLEERRARRTERLQAVQQPSYTEETVSEAKEAPSPSTSLASGEGYGKAFGTAVHELLELCVRRRGADDPVPATDAIETLLADSGVELGTGPVGRAEEMAGRLTQSSLWTALLKADSVYTEYPIARLTNPAAPSSGAEPPALRRGVIDLAYRTGEGWVLVDFKTDRVGEKFDGTLPADHAYVRQIQKYAEDWEAVLDEPVVRSVLWFADDGSQVEA